MKRRGLVLSGGGFFGAFQAGAYEALGSFDCVAGASAGALNAWAIAGGMPPAQLQQLWLTAATEARIGLHLPRYWGDGFLDTRRLEQMVEALVRDWRPRVDIAIVVSQGWDCHPVLLTNQDITADALLASCAVPFLLPAKRINNHLSVDGGLRDACPVWAARALGATEIVAINVWTHLPRWWPGRRRGPNWAGPDSLILEPPAPLGPLLSSATASRAQVNTWIAGGRHAARATFARQ